LITSLLTWPLYKPLVPAAASFLPSTSAGRHPSFLAAAMIDCTWVAFSSPFAKKLSTTKAKCDDICRLPAGNAAETG
jgi:hypothetical protein